MPTPSGSSDERDNDPAVVCRSRTSAPVLDFAVETRGDLCPTFFFGHSAVKKAFSGHLARPSDMAVRLNWIISLCQRRVGANGWDMDGTLDKATEIHDQKDTPAPDGEDEGQLAAS
ncbi:hypothetical protein E4U11_002061 [Claviceps purpurea]|nr:hypothetical protein E4U11_002061 [Claviceps purpurea]